MTRKPFAAFGRILYSNHYEQGEVFNVSTSAQSRTVLFFSSGEVVAKDRDTGELFDVCQPGWIAGSHKDKELVCTAVLPTVCWCYDPLVNQGFVPVIESFKLVPGQRVLFNSYTNLFLCEGIMSIDQNTYTGPYQLSVRGDNKKIALASTEVYGLIFK